MFNLDEAISHWRREMAASGIEHPRLLDELESHVRDDIDALVAAGIPEAQAFHLAVSRLGETASVCAEFSKLRKSVFGPLKIGTLLWASSWTLFAAGLFLGVIPGRLNLLLAAHIFSLTAGYAAALLTGGVGMYYVCCHWCRTLSAVRQQALRRAVLRLSTFAVGLVLAGLLLGMLWTQRNRGGYSAGGPREAGTLCAWVWLVGFLLIQRFRQVSDGATMLLAIVGNIIVSLAWFGAGIIAHGNRIADYWSIGALIAVHLLFFTMGVMLRFKTAERGAANDV